MTDFMFSVPWWVIAPLLGIGIGIFVYNDRRLNRPGERLGLAVVSLAVLWAAVSYLVATDLEKVDSGTRALTKAVLARNRPAIVALLSEDAQAVAWNRDGIGDGAVYYAQLTGLTGARVLSLECRRQSSLIIATLDVLSEHAESQTYAGMLRSTWELEWRKVDDHWLIRTITPIQIGQASREDIERRYLEHRVPKQK
jgi:hypothetical protein